MKDFILGFSIAINIIFLIIGFISYKKIKKTIDKPQKKPIDNMYDILEDLKSGWLK